MDSLIAIDPGTQKSGYVVVEYLRDRIVRLIDHGIDSNEDMMQKIMDLRGIGVNEIVFEKIGSYGMPVGAETFETVFWTGRMFEQASAIGKRCRISRIAVKTALCHSARAKDGNIRQRLIDLYGEPGTKKNQGVLYGIKSHEWSALALAQAFIEIKQEGGVLE